MLRLADRRNYHTFQPLLYQVATAVLEPEDIAHNLRAMFRRQKNFSFCLGEVSEVDLDTRRVVLEIEGARPATLGYDYLILALGATTNTYHVPGVEEHAFVLKTLDDAVSLRNHILRQFELVDAGRAEVSDGALTFLIAGGGPTGVELAGALIELVDHVLRRDFPHLDFSQAKVVLVEGNDSLLPGFHPRLGRNALKVLTSRRIEVKMGHPVSSLEADLVRLQGGTVVPTQTAVWAVGTRAVPLADSLGLPGGPHGDILVEPDLSLPGHPEVFVIGDMAGSKDPRGSIYPHVAPVAIQQGRHAARQIVRRLAGLPPEKFAYHNRGIMATIGRNAAVADLPGGLRIRGFLAWTAWLTLHIVELIGFRNRALVLLNWAWNYVAYERGARLIHCPSERRSETTRQSD